MIRINLYRLSHILAERLKRTITENGVLKDTKWVLKISINKTNGGDGLNIM